MTSRKGIKNDGSRRCILSIDTYFAIKKVKLKSYTNSWFYVLSFTVLSFPDTFSQQILYLSINGAEIIFSPSRQIIPEAR